MPRATALACLERFRRDGAWSRQVLGAAAGKNGLDPRDTALAARLFYGVLQNMAYLDFVADRWCRGRPEPKVRDILRLGTYELLFSDRIPPAATVYQAVELTRALGYARAAGLVNAVLRRVAENRGRPPEPPGAGTAEYLAVKYSHPLWMVRELLTLRDYPGAEAVLRADNAGARVFAQVNTLRADPAALARTLGAEPFDGVPGCLVLPCGDFTHSEAFAAGQFYVQDPAARLAVEAGAPRPGERVLDACAAPGGKSFAAAIAMEDRGRVLARDISDAKLNLVLDGAERMGLACIECACRDARLTEEAAFDLALADVPCSGLGVIRKKPDIRYRPREELERLPGLQAELLEAVSRGVRPGGRLVYSTCTWRREENEEVTGGFLARHPEFSLTLERTLWPDIDGTDGFYLCRMERNS